MKSDKTKTKKKAVPRAKINPTHCPEGMSLEQWQTALRAQAARREKLAVVAENRAREGYFRVFNPATGSNYSVVYRGPGSSWNYCSCPDFRTNRLGTCKHLEAVAAEADGKYARKRYSLPGRTSVYLDYRGERCVRIRIGGDNLPAMEAVASIYFDRDRTLKPGMWDRFDEFIEAARSIDPTIKVADDAFGFILSRREHDLRARIADTTPGLTDGLLKVSLYPYQREGAEFAFRNGRVIIADEMGLGKTIQSIAAAVLLSKHGFVRDTWIVCPTSLKYQWRSEIEKFTDMTVTVVEGNLPTRVRLLESDPAFFKIISYHSLVNVVRHGLRRMPDMVVYDEVQRLKNWDTKMAKTMRRLRSDYVVALSGTPIENRLSELYSVMQLVDQYVLGPYWQFVNDTTGFDESGRIVGYRNLNAVGRQLESVLIRRLKRDVNLQIPSRTDKNLLVPVTKEQMAVHDDCKQQVSMLLHRLRRLGFLPEKERQRMMLLLGMMRMAADSTYILDQRTRHDTKIDEALSIISDVTESGSEKIVIFSQWERMQRIMAAELEQRGVNYRFLHGGVPSAKRGKLIEDFIVDPNCRVFLSTDAGSTGLNLQCASIVINLDLPWNPAVLEQRIARVFRLGQERHVQVINMVSAGTIEETMLTTLAFKTSLFEGVLDGGDDAIVLSDEKFSRVAQMVETSLEDESDAGSTIIDEADEKEEIAETATDAETCESDDYAAPEDSETHDTSGSPDSPGSSDSSVGTGGLNPSESTAPAAGPELLAQGISLLGQLAKTLASPDSRRQLVDSIVKEDPATGQATLSIPVADKQTVAGILDMAAGLLATLKANR